MSNYHEETVYQRNSLLGYSLDWSNRPLGFKNYQHRPPLPLPEALSCPASFWETALPAKIKKPSRPPQAGELSRILRLSAGITRPRWEDGRMLGARAPASAGGLYPSELYVLTSGVTEVEDGLYHFTPLGPAWQYLWPGPLAAYAARSLGGRPARLTFFITSLFWRSLWKYNSRAYRYCLLDAGHMLANLELALAGFGFPVRSNINFADNSVSVLLGLANLDEAPLAAVRAGGAAEESGGPEFKLPPLDLEALPLSRRIGRDYLLLSSHRAGDLEQPLAEPLWHDPEISRPEELISLPVPTPAGNPSLQEIIIRRQSRRDFGAPSPSLAGLSLLLKACLPQPAPVMALVIAGTGLELAAGSYLYLPGRHALLARSKGQDWRRIVADACLGQGFIAKAKVQIILWADLDNLGKKGGPRFYRHAMLAAGKAGQRCYLAAAALGLNCCGVGAFYDDDLAVINGMPHRASPLYLLACG
ncbi:MAG: SagB/ThcOx family dehydrogenase [Desulfarculales bacterium]|jgi:SagB-type dehydrogenase family enzyme|nr:SagB/ThcOx family dehydrogenase [Desulfarculales bacterium]